MSRGYNLTYLYPPFHFDFKNFGYKWLSDSFYSNLSVYKMDVSVYPNGLDWGTDTHLTIVTLLHALIIN